MSHNLQVWLESERELTSDERLWLDKLLSLDFPGREALAEQAKVAKVHGYCRCGCRSVNLKVPATAPRFPYSERVPVEMIVDSPPVLFLVHVVQGHLDELEVLRGDGVALDGPVPLDGARLTINI